MRRLNATMARLTGEPVLYERGAAAVAIGAATRGRSEIEYGDEFGVAHLAEADDWLIDAAALVLDGQVTRPTAGDRIVHVDAAEHTHTYEVTHPGGEEPWRYSDPQRTRLRIHTKRIGT